MRDSASLLLALALAVAPARAGADLIERVAAFLEARPSPFEVVDMPGVGEIPGNIALTRDFLLPDGLTWGSPPQAVVPAGRLVVEIPPEAIRALTDDSQIESLLQGILSPPAEVDADPAYSILVEGVDTRQFPEIRLRFRIVPKDIESPIFSPAALRAANFRLSETVLGETRPVDELLGDQPLELCEESAIAIGIGIDTSCSVQSVIDDLKAKSLLFAREVLNPSRARSPKDAISLFAFDGDGKDRAPSIEWADDGDASTPSFYSVENQSPAAFEDFEDVDVGPPCDGSPIFESMLEEARRLVGYLPDDEEIQRVLVIFADFRDTRALENLYALEELVAANDLLMVGLGFGRVNENNIARVFDLDRETGSYTAGGFIQNGSQNTLRALKAVYDGLGYTYCLRYRTPFPNAFNEIVDTELRIIEPGTGAVSKARARYSLPLVVPEDSADVRVFLPLTARQHAQATERDDTVIRIEARFVPAADRADGLGPERYLPEPFEVPSSVLVDDPDLGQGFWLRSSDLGEGWDKLFRVPTEYVRVEGGDPDTAPRLLDVSRYELDVRIVSGATEGLGKPYEGVPVITVQDRTPPHVFLRLSPSTGVRPLKLVVREDGADADPRPLASGIAAAPGGRLDSAAVAPPGTGSKRALVAVEWVTPGGQAFEVQVTGQDWAGAPTAAGVLPPSTLVDPPGTPEDRRVLDAPQFVAGGLTVETGVRVGLEVFARDNFAVLDRVPTGHPVDGRAFLAPEPDDPAGPIHARFDAGRLEAQGVDVQPPFLPLVPRAELLADPRRPGVTWWIESQDPQDRFDALEGLREFQYSVDDAVVQFELVAAGAPRPPVPLRRIEVFAQDGQGNATRVTVPIFVAPSGFHVETIQAETERAR